MLTPRLLLESLNTRDKPTTSARLVVRSLSIKSRRSTLRPKGIALNTSITINLVQPGMALKQAIPGFSIVRQVRYVQ